MADLRWIFPGCLWVLFVGAAAGTATVNLICTEGKNVSAIEGQPVCMSFPIDRNTNSDDTYTIKQSSTRTSDDDVALFECRQNSGCINFTSKWTINYTPGEYQFKICTEKMTQDHMGSYRLESQGNAVIVDRCYLHQESQLPQTTDKTNAVSKIGMGVGVPLFCASVLGVMGLIR